MTFTPTKLEKVRERCDYAVQTIKGDGIEDWKHRAHVNALNFLELAATHDERISSQLGWDNSDDGGIEDE